MDIRLIGMFNAALSNERQLNFELVNEEAMKRGFIVQPGACTQSVLDYVESLDINYNATFYKEWSDILSKSRFELFIDQIMHYASTYGTNYQGTPYIPNPGVNDDVPVVSFDAYKVIVAVTPEQLFERCMGMLQSGIALHNDTLDAVCDYVIGQAFKGMKVDVDSIKNREALIRICDACRIYPDNPDSLLRLIVFKTTNNAMIIKNDDTIRAIYSSSTPFEFNKLNGKQLNGLARIFYRYRKIFLAFRKVAGVTARKNRVVINEIRRRARSKHVPIGTSFWNNVLSTYHADDEIITRLGDITNYKKLTLIQAINENLDAVNGTKKIYIVRNGRVYVTDRKKYIDKHLAEYQWHLREMLIKSVADSMKDKATYYRIPDGLDIACPTSEKNFIGNYPIGTNFQLSDHNFIGIYWKEEWGTRDFDLSAINSNGERLGWNSSYRTSQEDVVYSGDMTTANPEAAEVFYVKGSFNPWVFKVNQYNGEIGSQFRLFIGTERDLSKPVMEWTKNKDGYGRRNSGMRKCGYMVDPNSIQFTHTYTAEEKETTLGITMGNKFYLTNLRTGKSIVSNRSTELLDAMMNKVRYMVSLREILDAAGFLDFETHNTELVTNADWTQELVEKEWKEGEYIDFSQISKDTLINLFA